MNLKERYDEIMNRIERFDSNIEDKSHEDIADFYQNQFDAMQGLAEILLRAAK